MTECSIILRQRSRPGGARRGIEEPARRVVAGRFESPATGCGPARAPRAAAWFRLNACLFLWSPLLLLAVLTAVFRLSNADLEICRWCYGDGRQPWWSATIWPWQFLYAYGPLPALALGLGGLGVGILGLFWQRLRGYRTAGFFLAALLALGPGLLVNGVFKPNWQRPRPLQIQVFGGSQRFVPVWGWGADLEGKSFPSGHASMGFYLLAPAFLCYRRRRWALAFVALGLAGGLLIGAGRVAQGAHYPSDILWSAGMVYLSGLILWSLIRIASRARTSLADGRRAVPEPSLVLLRLPDPTQDRRRGLTVGKSSRRAA